MITRCRRFRHPLRRPFGKWFAAVIFAAGCGGTAEIASLEQAATCAGPTTVEGIDVSRYQGDIDWAKVRAEGRQFAIARVGYGTTIDLTFAKNWPAIKAANLVRGVYQYFRPSLDPVAQANALVATVGVLGDGDLPAVADVEDDEGKNASAIAAGLQAWLNAVAAGTGKTPMIYTNRSFWNGFVMSSFAGQPLWIANYGVTCPTLPAGWNDFAFWQYSASGTSTGLAGPVDLDRFNGSAAELWAFSSAPAVSDGGSSIDGGTIDDAGSPPPDALGSFDDGGETIGLGSTAGAARGCDFGGRPSSGALIPIIALFALLSGSVGRRRRCPRSSVRRA